MKTYLSILKPLYFLSKLTTGQIEALSNICMERRFQEGRAVYLQGARARHFYVVLDGEIEIWHKSDADLSDSLAVCRKGQVIGENVLTGEDIRQVSAIARTDCRVLAVNKDAFETLLGRFSDNGALYRNALESLPDGIFITDPHGRIRFMNAALRDMFDIPAGQARFLNSRTLLRRIWSGLGKRSRHAGMPNRTGAVPDASSFVRGGKTYEYFLSPILKDNDMGGFVWRFWDAGATRPLKTVSPS